mmetsp:Transcript_102981/g.286733  ORF Transcript_102981/g.286733 Transcript_102981/m.286733 type:complete len:203 (+) Transcript_102981:168-776(+)
MTSLPACSACTWPTVCHRHRRRPWRRCSREGQGGLCSPRGARPQHRGTSCSCRSRARCWLPTGRPSKRRPGAERRRAGCPRGPPGRRSRRGPRRCLGCSLASLRRCPAGPLTANLPAVAALHAQRGAPAACRLPQLQAPRHGHVAVRARARTRRRPPRASAAAPRATAARRPPRRKGGGRHAGAGPAVAPSPLGTVSQDTSP